MPDEFLHTRGRMIAHDLRQRGIHDERVLAAMRDTPREDFVPGYARESAYDDCALPISCDQTISQPYIVALMTQALRLTGSERVLEIGTGSGYQAAILAQLADEVISIERHGPLADQARTRLQQLGCANVRVVHADGSHGLADLAPFDRIIVTAAAAACPPELIEQLGLGGILVGPFGPADRQILQAIQKTENGLQISELTGCRFVPLVPRDDSPGE